MRSTRRTTPPGPGEDAQSLCAYIEDMLGQLAKLANEIGDQALAASIRSAEHEAGRSLGRLLR